MNRRSNRTLRISAMFPRAARRTRWNGILTVPFFVLHNPLSWKGAMMKRFMQITLAVTVITIVGCQVRTQGQQQERPREDGLRRLSAMHYLLATDKSVQDDLKLSEEQVKKIKELEAKEDQVVRDSNNKNEGFIKMRQQQIANEKALPNILDAMQLARLEQIELQRAGAQSLRYPDIARTLDLTDEQKESIKQSHTKFLEDIRGLSSEKARKKREEVRQAALEQMTDVLTAEQKMKWKEMLGQPFKGEVVNLTHSQKLKSTSSRNWVEQLKSWWKNGR